MAPFVESKSSEFEVRQFAHDFASPLAALKVAMGRAEFPDPALHDMTQAAFERLQRMVESLLRNTQAQMSPTTQLQKHLEESLQLFRLRWPDAKIIAQFSLPKKYQLSRSAAAKLSQQLFNLVNNSVESHAPGSTPNIQISVRTTKTKDLLIEVADTGHGIAPEILDKVTSRGFTTKKAGHGLGLSGLKSWLESLGGRIEIESSIHQGTKVGFRIPVTSVGLSILHPKTKTQIP